MPKQFQKIMHKFLAVLLLLFVSQALTAQKKITISGKEYSAYDNRWVTPSAKLIDQINLGVIFSVDDDPLFREKAMGNVIDTGYNYGIGLEYVKFLSNENSLGIYAGLGYELFPQKYQKLKMIIGYQGEGFFAFLPRLEWLAGWDINSDAYENQWRIFMVLLRYQEASFLFGLQTWDEQFDDGFYIFQLNYAIKPRKW
jgi:hypothetical protein